MCVYIYMPVSDWICVHSNNDTVKWPLVAGVVPLHQEYEVLIVVSGVTCWSFCHFDLAVWDVWIPTRWMWVTWTNVRHEEEEEDQCCAVRRLRRLNPRSGSGRPGQTITCGPHCVLFAPLVEHTVSCVPYMEHTRLCLQHVRNTFCIECTSCATHSSWSAACVEHLFVWCSSKSSIHLMWHV